MLVPYFGQFGAAIFALAFVVLALIAIAAFCYWLDGPRRELIREIKKRPKVTFTVRSGQD